VLERPQTSRHARGIADERNEPRYNPRILRAERVTDGPAGAGTRFQAELKAMGRTMPMTVEVTEFDRPRRLCVKDHLVDMETDGALTFAPVAGDTRMRWSWDVRPHACSS